MIRAMRCCALLFGLVAGCTFEVTGLPLTASDGGAHDLSIDLAGDDFTRAPDLIAQDFTPPPDLVTPDLACVAGCTSQATLHTCAGGGMDTTCSLGCSSTGSPHCKVIVPSGGAVTSNDLAANAALMDTTIGATVTINTDSGAISPGIRNATGSGMVDSGIEYRQTAGVGIFIFKSLTLTSGNTI